MRRVLTRLGRLIGIEAILFIFGVLGIAYSVVTPIFETPDEMAHFAYIKQLADGRGLPSGSLVIADDTPVQESSQPPLYYASAALVVRLFAPDMSDLQTWLQRNPAFPYIYGTIHHDNKNLLIHTRPEVLPYEGAARALHVARWVTLIFGALTVWATYRLGRETFPQQPAIGLLAAAMVAFTPQFLFISGAASNDPAASAWSAFSLWAAVRIMRQGFNLRRALALILALSLAALSKASTLGLIPLCLLAVLIVDDTPSAQIRARVKWVLLVSAVVALCVGPWYLRIWLSFGDVLGASTHMAMPWARPVPLSFGEAASKLPYAVTSYWIAFGWGNILAPDWIYTVLNVLALIGLVGVAVWGVAVQRDPARRVECASVLLFGTWVLLLVVALVRWIQLLDAAIGRLIFPAIAALSILLVVGWLHWLRRVRIVALIPLGLLVISIVALPAVMATAYARPMLLASDELAKQPGHALDIRFGDVARLIRLDVPRDHWPKPGGGTLLNLCWEPLQQDNRLLMVLVQIVGENNRVWFSRRTVPGLGSYPTSVWQPGGLFCDPVHVQIDDKTPPGVYRVEVALIDQGTQQRLPAYAPDGAELSANFVDQLKVAAPVLTEPSIAHAVHRQLGNEIALIGYDLDRESVKPGESIEVWLYWRALRQPTADYTVFAQVRHDNRIVAQKDGSPQHGAYPTSFWDAGEVVIDDRVIEIPVDTEPGKYPIKIGLYLPADGARLKVDGGPTDEVTLPVELEVQ